MTSNHWIKTRRHMWEKDEDGQVDMFAFEIGFHNGPICMICNLCVCEHCIPSYNELENCKEHYICSVCGQMEMDQVPYCPNCGAKMDEKENAK